MCITNSFNLSLSSLGASIICASCCIKILILYMRGARADEEEVAVEDDEMYKAGYLDNL
jgi:hypothetical protein